MSDGTVARSMLNYNTMTEALGALYYTLSSSISNEAVGSVLTMIIDDEGKCKKYETWDRTDEA